MASVGILRQIWFSWIWNKAYTLLISSFFHGAEDSEPLTVSGNLACQCSGQDADSNLKMGFSFLGNPRRKVFLRFHSRGGSLLIRQHLCAFRLDHTSHTDRMELHSPEENPKFNDREGNSSENKSWEEAWKSLLFNHEGCQNRTWNKTQPPSWLKNRLFQVAAAGILRQIWFNHPFGRGYYIF